MALQLTEEDGVYVGIALCTVAGAVVGKHLIDLAFDKREPRPKPPPVSTKPNSFDDTVKFVGLAFSVFVMIRDAPLLLDGIKAIEKELASR